MSTRFARSLKLKLFYGIPPPAKPVVSEPSKKPLVLLEIQQYQRLLLKISEHCSPQLCKALFNGINTVPNGTRIVPGQLLRPMSFNEAKCRSGGGGSYTDAGYRQSDPYKLPAVRTAFVFPCFFQAVNLVIGLWI